MSRFDYLIAKIEDAPISVQPFAHIYIENLFTPEDFSEILALPEINVPPASDDSDLFERLHSAGYKIINFPGCITDRDVYIDWHRTKERTGDDIHSACEGFGVTLRLMEPKSPLLAELDAFLASRSFNDAIARRFGIDVDQCNIDGGIQKYLDGYEISPHPDIRLKAATFMVNINPHPGSEQANHHTSYLKLAPEYDYISQFWEREKGVDRCWVPWDWCEVEWTQPANNSIVIFAPSSDTMHGVKADYDHLAGQRTQLYGNLWHKKMAEMRKVEWEGLRGGSIDAIEVPPLPRRLVPIGARKKVSQLLTQVLPSRRNGDGNFHRRKH